MEYEIKTGMDLAKETELVPFKAEELKIRTQADLDLAGAFLQFLKKLEAKICEMWDETIAKKHAEHKTAVMEKAKLMDRVHMARATTKGRIGAWAREQDNLRREEMLRQEEKKRLEQIALRSAQEVLDRATAAKEKAQREADLARSAAREAEAKAKDETERRQARQDAEKAESEGREKIVEIDKKSAAETDKVIAEAAEKESAMPVAQPAAKISLPARTARRVDWKWDIQSPALVERELCSPDKAKIGKAVDQAKAMGLAPFQVKIPGVRVWEEIVIITLKEKD